MAIRPCQVLPILRPSAAHEVMCSCGRRRFGALITSLHHALHPSLLLCHWTFWLVNGLTRTAVAGREKRVGADRRRL